MTSLIPVVDHAVINVDDQLDQAQALFVRMGFQLTGRGHHSMGSSNHLAIFGENYLELLGYEPDGSASQKGLWHSPIGLSGLVWKTDDADMAYQYLQQRQLAGEPPTAFFRPVTLPDGQSREARFCITRLNADSLPDGFSFFCQHLTPDAVWQPAWQQHANGVIDISQFVIIADHPPSAMQVYARLFQPQYTISGNADDYYLQAGKTRLRIISPRQAKEEFIALPDDYNGQPRMSALEFSVSSLKRVRDCLISGDIHFYATSNMLGIAPQKAFNTTLRFREWDY
ncbi:VOC family protein [Rahnella sp. SAP-1]|uniref:VOC family protein n=1 Tax=Rouxiella aceris TaxID=2703884 RepID=A0A848MEF3_9GAMM|nr:VOC family protein [Rouxiella aceris]NMP25571.1 VOC family protein [Rouxiella aceris]